MRRPAAVRAPADVAKRVRRTPEEARACILAAAERVFAAHLPDAVGLKEIGREAAVSHALVTHYFGTYTALVEATLERRFETLREELVPVITALVMKEADAKSILAAYRSAIAKAASDPTTVRLLTWALLNGRAAADDFFPHRSQGLKHLVDAVALRSRATRAELEFIVVATFSLTVVSTVGRRAFAGAFGRKPAQGLQEGFDRQIDAMLETYLEAAERRGRR